MNHIDPAKSARRLAIAGSVLLVLGGAMAFLRADEVVRAYFVAHFFWLNIAVGSLFILLIHELTGGAWGEYVRDSRKAAAGTLVLLALLFVPLWFGLGSIFPWAGEQRAMELHGHQAIWLQPGWHIARSAVCFVAWLAVAVAMRVFSPHRYDGELTAQAASGLIVLALVTTLFGIDWILALSLAGNSTMIGFVLIAGQLAGAVASSIVCVAVRHALGTPFGERDRDCLNDLGNLLLAGISFYAYVLYMQFLIVWEGNLPREIQWYVDRSGTMGRAVTVMLVATHIVIPFCCLLFRRVKRSVRAMAWVAATVLVGRLMQVYWDLMPLIELTHSNFVLVLDIIFCVALGALWLAAFIVILRRIGQPADEPSATTATARSGPIEATDERRLQQ